MFVVRFGFIAYWSVAILYVMPNNYIRAIANPLILRYQLFLYQQWDFFAPPPTANYRLYIESSSERYELLVPLMESKRRHAPFNSLESSLDYMVSNALLGVDRSLADAFEEVKLSEPNLRDEQIYQRSLQLFGRDQANNPDLKLIRLYCDEIANRSFPLSDKGNYSIRITRKPITPFRDYVRGKQTKADDESLLIELKP